MQIVDFFSEILIGIVSRAISNDLSLLSLYRNVRQIIDTTNNGY